ncbi:lysylphosphatidylglycerol synthase transmembrane domain-containing protein [Microbacterium sp. ASV49]|uniref:Lysylphosphatidylglycerol synthase transmembrane domain-containing protein n=1 Tax=Microbacterium candidum TaxID=3041922 RepID=A0ABT7MVC6_9MICO|nr:lysylphosphatidylglycerol synthase transmembrane domain-containing protein [Microbacterium sp. ASV49]MDL9978404.1 lysylphosphatidylglycerol synthase transmembrane domain-containing protein [Microbacterium sp. ASV49]
MAVNRAVRITATLVVVAATVVAVGVGPFLKGIASLTPLSIALAFVLAAIATVAAAWRWRVVSRSLGLPLPWGSAVGAYYRSQFLNTVLPGGVLGDVHRAYAHGRPEGRVGDAARAVAAERVAGQIVQCTVTVAILLPLGLAVSLAPVLAVGAVIVAALVGLFAIPRARRILRRELGMLRPLLARPRALFAVVAASVLVLGAHVTLFVVAGYAVGVPAGPRELSLMALVVLAAATIPLNVGGWGPREAASAAAFAIAGLGGGAGVSVSTAYGVLAMAALAPGAVILLADRIRGRVRAPHERTPA